jgi:hypothetical protein
VKIKKGNKNNKNDDNIIIFIYLVLKKHMAAAIDTNPNIKNEDSFILLS